MAKKRVTTKDADSISDLLELAEKVNMPSDALDGEICDEVHDEARDRAKQLCDGLLIDKLEYLVERGYKIARLKELITDPDA